MSCDSCEDERINTRPLILVDAVSGEIIHEIEICKECREKYEYVIGIVSKEPWDDQQ